MQPFSPQDYKTILTAVIQKQIAILGPQITLAKAQSVAGLTVDSMGNVTSIAGDPQIVMQTLIDQFVQLSGLIVKKTLEPLYLQQQDGTTTAVQPTVVVKPVEKTITASETLVQTPTHLDMPQTINAQSGETQDATDIQSIIDDAVKGVPSK